MSNLYSKEFYELQSSDSYKSAKVVLDEAFNLIRNITKVSSVIDYGCGIGAWLAAAKELGVKEVLGLDGAYVDKNQLMIDQSNFLPADLSKPSSIPSLKRKYDLAISLEVAEHLSIENAETFIERLTESSDIVLFSAAIPYQGGHGHVNENWVEYWSNKFTQKGFRALDILRPKIWTNIDVCWWYRQNCIIYVSEKLIDDASKEYSTNKPLSFVHPEQFLVSVHREKTFRRYTLKDDINYLNYLNAKTGDVETLSYGEEYSYFEKTKSESINSLSELQDSLSNEINEVIRDAISPISYDFRNLSGLELSKNKNCVPDFLCVGAQKSGTTWLEKFLRKQQSIWLPPLKELNFFNNLVFKSNSAYSGSWRRKTALSRLKNALTYNVNIEQPWFEFLVHLCKERIDISWYTDIFKRAPGDKVSGELTPEYMLLPVEAIKFIRDLNEDIKIIFILRRPSDRTKSHLRMIFKENPNISKSCLNELISTDSIKYRSSYRTHVENWLKVFPREQLLLINYDNLFKNTEITLNKISNFLGAPFINIENVELEKVHASVNELPIDDRSIYSEYEKLDSEWLKLDFD